MNQSSEADIPLLGFNKDPSERKAAVRDLSDRLAPVREWWIQRNAYFYQEDRRYMRFLVPEGLRILDVGCGTGDLLASLRPAYGVGIDFSSEMIRLAKERHPEYKFHVVDIEDDEAMASVEGTFDVIVLSDVIGALDDCETALINLKRLCTQDTRLIVAYYNTMWEPVLKLGEIVKLKMPQAQQNWLSTEDIENILNLAGFQVVKREWRQLFPRSLFGVGTFINRYLAPLPVLRRACLRNYVIARTEPEPSSTSRSVSVVIPCRNERGNVRYALQRMPKFCDDLEIIFVEGNSTDGTLEEIQRVVRDYSSYDIKILTQDGVGKGDAVRKGFAHARGDVLMILDADLTVPPEDLPKFYRALVSGKGEFINGSRLVYPMEQNAMQFLNLVANRLFSWVFSWLLNQGFTDTLCGTKVLFQRHYHQIVANRKFFGEFDPFGDFDLIFGACKLNLKVVEVPVRYRSREYGSTQIARFRHGWLLLRMVWFAFRKLKAF